jgi:hypothetical protein
MSTGVFVNCNIPYAKGNEASQAQSILKMAKGFIDGGAVGAAITYSANYGQTREIEKVYFGGGWDTKTTGANQAEVVQEMEALLGGPPYEDLQGRFRLCPITTMNAYPGDDPLENWNEDLLRGIVTTDLDRIKSYLEAGWCVLGWQNQATVNDDKHPYAVGGGVAKLPAAISDQIQKTLIACAQQYPEK